MEWLIAAPVALIVGLGVLQWALVIQAKQAVDFAAQQAVRYAARDFGRGAAVNLGLSTGLQPFWLLPNRALALVRVSQGIDSGWIAWQRVHPEPTVFEDFGERAKTQSGDMIAADLEIPNDNLRYWNTTPGRRSNVTIQAANRLSVELTYGIKLPVPVISALIVRVMEIVDGCRPTQALLLVNTVLGRPGQLNQRRWTCPIYRAPAIVGGRPVWRLPIRVRAERWMQSPLRRSSARNSASADGQPSVLRSQPPLPTGSAAGVLSAPTPSRPPNTNDGPAGSGVGFGMGQPLPQPGLAGSGSINRADQDAAFATVRRRSPHARSALERMTGGGPISQPGACS